jgi:hypothetical protein
VFEAGLKNAYSQCVSVVVEVGSEARNMSSLFAKTTSSAGARMVTHLENLDIK